MRRLGDSHAFKASQAEADSKRKRCPRCERTKPLEDFNRCSKTLDGRQGWCAECMRSSQREWAEANPEQARARWRKRWHRAVERHGPKQTPREKLKARHQLAKAIRAGTVTRPATCSSCGESPKSTRGISLIQGHHEDYSKPLEVSWLCARCHARLHVEEREAA